MGGTVAGLVVIALLAVSTLFRTRARLKRLEAAIRSARELATGGISFRPLDETWRAALEGLDVPAGMRALGDFLEVPEGREPSGALRGFADAEGTIYGWTAKVGPTKRTVMVLVTATESDVYLTRLTPAVGGLLGAPTWAHREAVPYAQGIEGALARHRERVANVANAVRVTTLDELQAELQRVRAKTVAWRRSEPPATLLEADLRSMLGRHYDTLGPKLAKRLAVDLPVARVVS